MSRLRAVHFTPYQGEIFPLEIADCSDLIVQRNGEIQAIPALLWGEVYGDKYVREPDTRSWLYRLRPIE